MIQDITDIYRCNLITSPCEVVRPSSQALTYKEKCQTSTTERWRDLVQGTLDDGVKVISRGFTCLERLGVSFIVDMQRPLVLSQKRRLGYRFMCAEAAWILSGDNKVASIAPFSKQITSFSDDGITFFGAYGPRILPQLDYILRTLADDQGSRQAVLSIWRENPPHSKDIPCSLTVQWLIRDNQLHCMLNMRSSDIWLGVPYDIFNFSMLSLYLLKKLSLKLTLGDLHLYAGSSHLYEKDVVHAAEAARSNEIIFLPINLALLNKVPPTQLAATLWDLARRKGDQDV